MRNKIKILAIALAAVIGFGVVSCGDENDDDTISGNNIVSGADVVYAVDNLAEAKKATDFSYSPYYNDEIKPLSYYLDGTPSVTVNNNKTTIILGTPKPNFLENLSAYLSFMGGGVTVNPSNAKFFSLVSTYTFDGKYMLICMKNEEEYGSIFYVDRDVTVKGNGTIEHEEEAPQGGTTQGENEATTFNMSLKKGWNYLVRSYNKKTNTITFTSSTSQPSGYKWTITNNWSEGSGSGGGSGGDYHYYDDDDDDYYYYDDDDDYYYDDDDDD